MVCLLLTFVLVFIVDINCFVVNDIYSCVCVCLSLAFILMCSLLTFILVCLLLTFVLVCLLLTFVVVFLLSIFIVVYNIYCFTFNLFSHTQETLINEVSVNAEFEVLPKDNQPQTYQMFNLGKLDIYKKREVAIDPWALTSCSTGTLTSP